MAVVMTLAFEALHTEWLEASVLAVGGLIYQVISPGTTTPLLGPLFHSCLRDSYTSSIGYERSL